MYSLTLSYRIPMGCPGCPDVGGTPRGGRRQVLLPSTPHTGPLPTPRSKAAGGAPGLHREGSGGPGLPLLVSLSLIRKEPALLIGARSCLSASLRQIDLKNHLEKKSTKADRPQRVATLPGILSPKSLPSRDEMCSCCQLNPELSPSHFDT